MIQANKTKQEIEQLLCSWTPHDKRPLIEYAGFDNTSQLVGTARRTCSLVLSSTEIASIKTQLKPIYETLVKDSLPYKPSWSTLPFDMVRLDCYFDQYSGHVKVLEINTRNVGMHEFATWIDDELRLVLGGKNKVRLDELFVKNQVKMIADSGFKEARIAYFSNPQIPRWSYIKELKTVFDDRFFDVGPEADLLVTDEGLYVDGALCNVVIKKYASLFKKALKKQRKAGGIFELQPRWMHKFGGKVYLKDIHDKAILKTTVFEAKMLDEYVSKKDELVLKVNGRGNSTDVFLGKLLDDETWYNCLQRAVLHPNVWVIQEFCSAPVINVVEHGKKPKQMAVQLGVFILPDALATDGFTIDIVVKAHASKTGAVMFDPAGQDTDIVFGNVIVFA